MADVHSYICLDIPHHDGTFRNQLNLPGFSYNPIVRPTVEIEDSAYYNEEEFENENNEDYEIGKLSDW